jgi:hypothetical protein
VIITEPSNPWTVGVGSVFSKEFYELAKSRLKPGGVVAQWFHIYELNDGILTLVLRTFNSVFPFMEIWDTGNGDIVMLGALQPWRTGVDVFEPAFGRETVRSDLASIHIFSPAGLLSRQLASQRTAFAIADDGEIQTDMFPILEYAAPRAFYIAESSWLLMRFDERTYQQVLAPPQKTAVLRSLPLAEAQLVFTNSLTINFELIRCLSSTTPDLQTPCVFRTNSPPATVWPGSGENSVFLHQAVTALNAGDFDQAQRLAALVLARDPADLQAAYLARVVDRERQLLSGQPVAAP